MLTHTRSNTLFGSGFWSRRVHTRIVHFQYEINSSIDFWMSRTNQFKSMFNHIDILLLLKIRVCVCLLPVHVHITSFTRCNLCWCLLWVYDMGPGDDELPNRIDGIYFCYFLDVVVCIVDFRFSAPVRIESIVIINFERWLCAIIAITAAHTHADTDTITAVYHVLAIKFDCRYSICGRMGNFCVVEIEINSNDIVDNE